MSITRDDYVSVLEEFYGDWPGMERVLSACADSLVALHGEENATLLAQLATDQLRGDVAYDRAVAAEQENARLARENSDLRHSLEGLER